MVRVGLIGCGKITQVRHIPEYLSNKDAEIAGYFDFNHERACELAEKFGGKAYDTMEELLADESIDAVSVCVANNAHASVTIQALDAGKHVLCEKPMATTIEDCEAMVEAAERSGKKLMIDQNQRLAKAHAKAMKLLRSGAIGEVITFKTNFGHGGPETWSIDPGKNSWFFDRKKAAMGAMADLGIHKTDLIQYLLHQKVVAVTAKVVTLDKKDANGNLIGVDDNAFCIYEMSQGVIGTMSASWTYYGQEDNSTIVYGTEGILKMYNDPEFSICIVEKDGTEVYYKVDQIQTNDNQTSTGVIDAFVESIVNDTEPLISGQTVLPAMRAVFAAIQSSDEGRRIEIKENEEAKWNLDS